MYEKLARVRVTLLPGTIFFHINGTSALKVQIYVVISLKVGNQQMKAIQTIVMVNNTDTKVWLTL